MDIFVELMKAVGPTAGLVLMFIYWNQTEKRALIKTVNEKNKETKKEKDELAARVQFIEDYQRNELTDLIKQTTEVLSKNTTILEEVNETLIKTQYRFNSGKDSP